MEWKKGPIIGQGSSATVSVATTATGDIFAVKSTSLSTSISLQNEQHFLSQLTSNHIIKYIGFDINYINNKPMYNLFLEYATNGTVCDMINKLGGSVNESLIRSYTYQVLSGLDYLHANNIVHCDIKCSNLLVCEDGVKIGDLGCAKMAQSTTTSSFYGTPVYMAPEVARGEEQGFPADVWAVGCTIIEMATGSNAWPEVNDPVSGLYRIGYSGEVPKLPKCLSENGKDFLEKCLRKDAKERWTIKELLQHPFVCDLSLNFGTKNSPTSVLDHGFWESLPVPEVSPTVVDFSSELILISPVERIRELVEASSSTLPNWDDDNADCWIMVRNHGPR